MKTCKLLATIVCAGYLQCAGFAAFGEPYTLNQQLQGQHRKQELWLKMQQQQRRAEARGRNLKDRETLERQLKQQRFDQHGFQQRQIQRELQLRQKRRLLPQPHRRLREGFERQRFQTEQRVQELHLKLNRRP